MGIISTFSLKRQQILFFPLPQRRRGNAVGNGLPLSGGEQGAHRNGEIGDHEQGEGEGVGHLFQAAVRMARHSLAVVTAPMANSVAYIPSADSPRDWAAAHSEPPVAAL